MFEAGQSRPHYNAVVDRVVSLTPPSSSAPPPADLSFRNLHCVCRPIRKSAWRNSPFDLILRIITAAEWDTIEAGFIQHPNPQPFLQQHLRRPDPPDAITPPT
jgi:uncharacterized circularly permuted ATP-grasp superfamily protein